MVFKQARRTARVDPDERIRAHLVSVWREARRFMSIGGREGMLLLTDRHLCFVHKTEAKKKWWTAIVARQALRMMRSKHVMILHDGYGEADLARDLANPKNDEIPFDQILDVRAEEKEWGSVLMLDYARGDKRERFQYSIARDWVKYPAKEPTRYLRVSWEPFIGFINDHRVVRE